MKPPWTPPLAADVAFTQGVASSEPSASAITLWTEVDGLTAKAKLAVEVAPDLGFARTVLRTTAVALPEQGGAVRAVPRGRRSPRGPAGDAALRDRAALDRTHGSLRLGGVGLFLLDSRQYRDDQPCSPAGGAFSEPCAPEVLEAPRTLPGAAQKAWLKDAPPRTP